MNVLGLQKIVGGLRRGTRQTLADPQQNIPRGKPRNFSVHSAQLTSLIHVNLAARLEQQCKAAYLEAQSLLDKERLAKEQLEIVLSERTNAFNEQQRK